MPHVLQRDECCFCISLGGQAQIRRSSFALENLSAELHRVGTPCAPPRILPCNFVTIFEGSAKAAPLFHAGSTVTMLVDLASAHAVVGFSGLAGGRVKEAAVPRAPLTAFVSLYNRGASFTLVAEEEECGQ